MKKVAEKLPSIENILETMHELFHDFPITELNYETPFQCLIAVMMSAQTTDIQVNKVTDSLFIKIKGPQDVLDMGEEALGEAIRTVGLRTSKKKNVFKTATLLVEKSKEITTVQYNGTGKLVHHLPYDDTAHVYADRGYFVPDTLEGMMELPGVGLKTAKVVLYVLYRQKRIAVDTHVHRVMNRLGVIDTTDPNKSSVLLEDIIPDSHKDIAHHSIIYFGRYLCKAKKPECHRCPLQESCKRYKQEGSRK